jgi:hypothetical protein
MTLRGVADRIDGRYLLRSVQTLVVVCAIAGCSRRSDTHAPRPSAEAISIALTSDQRGSQELEVTGMSQGQIDALAAWAPDDARWPELLRVAVAGRGDGPVMLGSYSVTSGKLRFAPRFAWQPGLSYSAELRRGQIDQDGEPDGTPSELIAAEFTIAPAAPISRTRLEAVYPSSKILPENLLKFYLHFSAPMARGEAYERIHLLDAEGRTIERAFLELGEELWDPAATRFTLFFDPGRIKRGLKPREDLGPVLLDGQSYTLVVDAAWRDASGRPLADAFGKSFEVGPPDEVSPDIRNWSLDVPQGNSLDPLAVVFPEPLDHALVTRLLSIVGPEGEELAGEALVDREETRWRFQPTTPWQPGLHYLRAGSVIEDRSGNSLARPFEVDVQRAITQEVSDEILALPFEIAGDSGP